MIVTETGKEEEEDEEEVPEEEGEEPPLPFSSSLVAPHE